MLHYRKEGESNLKQPKRQISAPLASEVNPLGPAMDVQCPGVGAPQQTAIARFNVVCRVCGNENENSIDIFGADGQNYGLALKMNTYLPVKVTDGDSLPSNCCWNCVSSILSWHELVVASIETDRKLKELQVIDAKPLVVLVASPKVEVEFEPEPEPEVVLPHIVSIVIKKEEECSINTTNSLDRKAEASKGDEMTHLKSSQNSQKPICDVCGKSFSSNSTLSRHKKKFHKGDASQPNPNFTCSVCNKSFTESRNLMRHKRNFHENAKERTYICKLCREEFSEKTEYFSHVKEMHSKVIQPVEGAPDENSQKFFCNMCDNGYGRKGDLIRHIKTKHQQGGKDERTYTCKTCREEFSEKTEYLCHVREVHSELTKPVGHAPDENSTKFSCNICDCSYVRNSDLIRHIRTKHSQCGADVPTKRINIAKYKLVIDDRVFYECDICKKRYDKPFSFSVHRRVHTRGVCSHVCDVCGKRYTTKSSLWRHRNENHTARRFACKVCGAQFRAKILLAQHLNIHSDSRPYACDACGKAFRQKSALSTHKLRHGAGFQFGCDLCGKSFRLRERLQQHMRNHDPLETCSCDVCGDTFSQPKYLDEHKRSDCVNNVDECV